MSGYQKELANERYKIYLLPRSETAKSADIITDNKIGGIKHQKEHGFSSILDRNSKTGKFQRVRVVVIYTLEKTTLQEILDKYLRKEDI
jgi:hypothetical protein